MTILVHIMNILVRTTKSIFCTLTKHFSKVFKGRIMGGNIRFRNMMMKKVSAIVVMIAFLSSSVLQYAQAAPVFQTTISQDGVSADVEKSYAELDIETFTIPAHLGDIKYTHKGNSGRFIVHIQDAHCNRFAQHRISDIIEYLNEEYGLNIINLEGGSGEYDLDVFTSITGREIRREVGDYFLKKGELNGAEFYAVNNPDKVSLWGVEDKDLYLANLKVYRDSLGYKAEVDELLKKLTHVMNNLKRHIYTPELLEMDMTYNAYKSGSTDFRGYVEFLIRKARAAGIEVRSSANLYLLMKAMEMESDVDFKKAGTERNALIDDLKNGLSKDEIKELVTKTIAFKTKRISRKAFYNYILRKAREIGISTSRFPELSNYIVYVSLYEAVDKFKIMDEINDLEKEIKEPLYGNEVQRELDTLSRNFALTKNMFALSFTKADYDYYVRNHDAFGMANYLSFIKKEAPKYNISAGQYDDISKLDGYRDSIARFYEYSFKRDDVFVKNLRFSESDGGLEKALLMTGGFHTENLCKLFEDRDISYVSIIPKFTSEKEYESPYFKLLGGNVTDMQHMLTSVFIQASMMQIASMLSPIMADAVWGEEQAQAFRAAVMIQAMARTRLVNVRVVDAAGLAVVTVNPQGMVVGEEGAVATGTETVELGVDALLEMIRDAGKKPKSKKKREIDTVIDMYLGKNAGERRPRSATEQRKSIVAGLQALGLNTSVAEGLTDNFGRIFGGILGEAVNGRQVTILRDDQDSLVGMQGMTMAAYEMADPVLGRVVIKFPREGLLEDGVTTHYKHVFIEGSQNKAKAQGDVDRWLEEMKKEIMDISGMSEEQSLAEAQRRLSEVAKGRIAEIYKLMRRKLGNLFAPVIIEGVRLSVEEVDADGRSTFREVELPYVIIQQKVTPLAQIFAGVRAKAEELRTEIEARQQAIRKLGVFGTAKIIGKEKQKQAEALRAEINAFQEQLSAVEAEDRRFIDLYYDLQRMMGEKGIVDKDAALNFRNNYGLTDDGRIVGFDVDFYSEGTIDPVTGRVNWEGQKLTTMNEEELARFNREHPDDMWESISSISEAAARDKFGALLAYLTGEETYTGNEYVDGILRGRGISLDDIRMGRSREDLEVLVEAVLSMDVAPRASPAEIRYAGRGEAAEESPAEESSGVEIPWGLEVASGEGWADLNAAERLERIRSWQESGVEITIEVRYGPTDTDTFTGEIKPGEGEGLGIEAMDGVGAVIKLSNDTENDYYGQHMIVRDIISVKVAGEEQTAEDAASAGRRGQAPKGPKAEVEIGRDIRIENFEFSPVDAEGMLDMVDAILGDIGLILAAYGKVTINKLEYVKSGGFKHVVRVEAESGGKPIVFGLRLMKGNKEAPLERQVEDIEQNAENEVKQFEEFRAVDGVAIFVKRVVHVRELKERGLVKEDDATDRFFSNNWIASVTIGEFVDGVSLDEVENTAARPGRREEVFKMGINTVVRGWLLTLKNDRGVSIDDLTQANLVYRGDGATGKMEPVVYIDLGEHRKYTLNELVENLKALYRQTEMYKDREAAEAGSGEIWVARTVVAGVIAGIQEFSMRETDDKLMPEDTLPIAEIRKEILRYRPVLDHMRKMISREDIAAADANISFMQASLDLRQQNPAIKYPGTEAPAGVDVRAVAKKAREAGNVMAVRERAKVRVAVDTVNNKLLGSFANLDITGRITRIVRVEDVEIVTAALGDVSEALSYMDGRKLVIILNSTDNRAADYFADDAVLAQMIRHEFIEADHGRFRKTHRDIKALEVLENLRLDAERGALTPLNELILKHMTAEQLANIVPEHDLDPGGKFYRAAQIELAARKVPEAPAVAAGAFEGTWFREEISEIEDLPVRGLSVKEKVVPIPDVHGDLAALRDYLEGAGVIKKRVGSDGAINDLWIGRNVTVVQMGDMIDRGQESKEAVEYIRKLQAEAARPENMGSKVIRLIGNHEMAYLFHLSEDPTDKIRVLAMQRSLDKDLLADREFIGGIAEDIRNRNLVAAYEVGGKVFTHGMVTKSMGDAIRGTRRDMSNADFVSEVNRTVSDGVARGDYSHPVFNIGHGKDGEDPGIFAAYITKIGYYGDIYDAFEQVVGHDPTGKRLKAAVGGKVICVDVGMTGHYGSGRVGIVFENGRVYRITPSAQEQFEHDTSAPQLRRWIPPSVPVREEAVPGDGRLTTKDFEQKEIYPGDTVRFTSIRGNEKELVYLGVEERGVAVRMGDGTRTHYRFDAIRDFEKAADTPLMDKDFEARGIYPGDVVRFTSVRGNEREFVYLGVDERGVNVRDSSEVERHYKFEAIRSFTKVTATPVTDKDFEARGIRPGDRVRFTSVRGNVKERVYRGVDEGGIIIEAEDGSRTHYYFDAVRKFEKVNPLPVTDSDFAAKGIHMGDMVRFTSVRDNVREFVYLRVDEQGVLVEDADGSLTHYMFDSIKTFEKVEDLPMSEKDFAAAGIYPGDTVRFTSIRENVRELVYLGIDRNGIIVAKGSGRVTHYPFAALKNFERAEEEEETSKSDYLVTSTGTSSDMVSRMLAPDRRGRVMTAALARAVVRDQVRNVIRELRTGTRASLAGRSIPELTAKMEEVFRSGMYTIWEMVPGERYQLIWSEGKDEVESRPWSKLGLPDRATLADQKRAYRAFKAWQDAQVGFPEADITEARAAFMEEFGIRYGIEIKNEASAGDIYYVMEILGFLPESLLASDAVLTVDLRAERDRGAMFAQYVEERGEVGLVDNAVDFDRYLLTGFLTHELGHALMRNMNDQQMARARSLFDRFWSSKGALIGVDFMAYSANSRKSYQADFGEFFAENFMHFIILGEKGMVGEEGPNQSLRRELFDFYSELCGGNKLDVSGDAASMVPAVEDLGTESHRDRLKDPIYRMFNEDQRRFMLAVIRAAEPVGPAVVDPVGEAANILLFNRSVPGITSREVRRFLEVRADGERYNAIRQALTVRAEKRRHVPYAERTEAAKSIVERKQLIINGLSGRDMVLQDIVESGISDAETAMIITELIRSQEGKYGGMRSEVRSIYESELVRAREMAYTMTEGYLQKRCQADLQKSAGDQRMMDSFAEQRSELALAIKRYIKYGKMVSADRARKPLTDEESRVINAMTQFTFEESRIIVAMTRASAMIDGEMSEEDAVNVILDEVFFSDRAQPVTPDVAKEYLKKRNSDINRFRRLRSLIFKGLERRIAEGEEQQEIDMTESLRRRMDGQLLAVREPDMEMIAAGMDAHLLDMMKLAEKEVVSYAARAENESGAVAAGFYEKAAGVLQSFLNNYSALGLPGTVAGLIRERIKGMVDKAESSGRSDARGTEDTPALKYPGTDAPVGINMTEITVEARRKGRIKTAVSDKGIKRALDAVNDTNKGLLKSFADLDKGGKVFQDAQIGDIEIVTADLGDVSEALSYPEGDKLIIILNSAARPDGTGSRAADYFANDTAMAQMIRHEFVEANPVFEKTHRQIKELELQESLQFSSKRGALTPLNSLVIKHMTEEQLADIALDHELDPGGKFYAAVQVELDARAAVDLLDKSRPGEHPSVTLLPVTSSQMLMMRSSIEGPGRETKRTLMKRYGLNIHVVYYTVDAPDVDAELEEVMKSVMDIEGFSTDPLSRIVAYADQDSKDVVEKEKGLKKNAVEKSIKAILSRGALSDRFTGVVPGTFTGGIDTERFSIVRLAIMGMGLMERQRAYAAKETKRAGLIEERLKNMFMRMVTTPGDFTHLDPKSLIEGLFKGTYIMRITKINYNEMREYVEAEAAVLESL